MTKKIIILEPNEGLRESLNLILENYNLFHADDPASALEILSHLEEPNLFIVDINFIPDPLDFLKLVRLKYAPELKVLLLSTNFTLDFQESVIRIGTDFSFKTKPFGKNLLDYVQILLGDRSGSVNYELYIKPNGDIAVDPPTSVDL